MPTRAIALTNPRSIILAGGGGKSGGSAHVATEDPDTLSSRSEVRMMAALGNGEMGDGSGNILVNGMKSVALGDGNDFTRVQNLDGTYNVENFDIFLVPGTQSQQAIPGFDAAEATIPVNVRVKKSIPWVHTVSDSSLQALRVDIRIPRLEAIRSNGDRTGTTVHLKIEVQNSGGAYVTKIDDTINDKATDPYLRTYRLNLPAGFAPWNIRVTRITADSDSDQLYNETWVDSYTEVVWGKFRHPNIAKIAIAIDAQQFNNIPTIALETYGRIIQVPRNYNPITRVYATTGAGTTGGIWDGTFWPKNSNSPPWVWYDVVTYKLAGLGKFIATTSLNKFNLYTCAQYCDGLVPDGMGGTEPRMVADLYLQERAPALKVLSDIASIFRAMIYYGAGTIVPVQDAPIASVSHHFTIENVIGGRFVYGINSRSARHTVVYVTWNDQANFGKAVQEYVPDHDAIRDRGVLPISITAMGCSSRGQAHRLGRWLLLSETLDSTITFQTGQEGMKRRPGELIETHDPYRSGKTLGGRLHAATTTTLTLDKSVVIEAGKTYAVSTLKTDGSVDRRNITNGTGTTSTLTVTPAYTTAPDPETVFILAVSDLQPQQWKIIRVVPKDKATVEIVALEYNASKFNAIDNNTALEDLPTSTLPSPFQVLPPGAITIRVLPVIGLNNAISQTIKITWARSADHYVKDYAVRYRRESGGWTGLYLGPGLSAELPHAHIGFYEFAVFTINTQNRWSAPRYADTEISTANPIFPARVVRLELTGQGNDTVPHQPDFDFSWDMVSPAMAQKVGLRGTGSPDPYFESFEVSMWRGNIRIRRTQTKNYRYRYTLAQNRQDFNDHPTPAVRIEVRIKDSIGELLPPKTLTAVFPRPDPPTIDDDIQANHRTIDVFWNAPVARYISRYQIARLSGASLASSPPNTGLLKYYTAGARALSFHDTGLNETLTYSYWIRAIDVFEQTSDWVFLGSALADIDLPEISDPNTTLLQQLAVAAITFRPDGGAIVNPTNVRLDCPTLPALPIYYTTDNSTPTTTSNLYNPNTGFNLIATTTVKARVIHSLFPSNPGLVNTKTFTILASTVITPSSTVANGSYETQTGSLPCTLSTPTAADALFYNVTYDGSTPGNPAHVGGTPTAPTKKLAGNSWPFVIPRGRMRLKVLGYKNTWTDSGILTVDITVRKRLSSGNPGDDGGPDGDPRHNIL